MVKKILGSLLLGSALLSGPGWAQAPENVQVPVSSVANDEVTEVEVFLKGYVFGLRIAKVKYQTGFTDNEYYSLASMKTSGLGAFLKKWAIWSVSTGSFDGQDIVPATHLQQNLNLTGRTKSIYPSCRHWVHKACHRRARKNGLKVTTPCLYC